jgi:hypothetical protein
MSKIKLLLLVLLTSACSQTIVTVNNSSSDCVTKELIKGKYTNGAILALCNEQR